MYVEYIGEGENFMPPKKENHTRFNVNLPNDLLKKIEDYQFENRHKDRNEAIEQLLKRALEIE